MVNQAEIYIEEVTSGEKLTGKWQRLAVERHLKDLENGHERGLMFDKRAGKAAIELIKEFRHVKGKWANKPFQLTNWQAFCVYSLFGWKVINGYVFLQDWKNWRRGEEADLNDAEQLPTEELFNKKIVAKSYVRRFKKAFFEMAKKNGKTEFAAAIANVLLLTNKDEEAEYYWAATTFPQASIGWERQKAMIDKNVSRKKFYKSKFGTNSKRIWDKTNRSKVVALAKETERAQKDGIGAKGGFIDEYHLHDSNYMITQLESSAALYDEPLILIITTAGFNPYCVCKDFEDLCKLILLGTVQNDEIFAIIFQIDEGDNWEDPKVWGKANPNIGESPTWAFMKKEYQKAKLEGGAALTTFIVKNLNIWTKNREIWIDTDVWQQNERLYTDEQLKDLPCWGAIDLASNRDFNAKTLLWELPNGDYYSKTHFWIPEQTLKIKKNKARGIDFEKWVSKGFITVTEGNYMDFDIIAKSIYEDNQKFNIQYFVFDRWKIEDVQLKLQKLDYDFATEKFLGFGQGFASMGQPTIEVERMINLGKIFNDGNKCMEWQLTNVHLKKNEAGWFKIDKEKSVDKVDGPVSLVMAFGAYLLTKGKDQNFENVLESRSTVF